jgi:dihydroorotase
MWAIVHSRSISRREFVTATVGAVALCRASPGAQAGKYDLIIRGGRVIDPSARLDAVRDVAITRARIAAVGVNINAAAAQTIDGTGKLVVPGLIDIHTHAGRSADGPGLALKDGVTAWIDAGSQGADRIDDVAAVARSSPQIGRVLINIGREGILPDGDTTDLARADVAAARAAIARHRDVIVGVKVRLSATNTANDYEALRRAQEAASAFSLPVMIHMGQSMSALPKLLALLKRGDIVSHMLAPEPNSILDDRGQILPAVQAARKRGVWFDVGNGVTGHIRWDVVEKVAKQKFWPDTISTDWNTMSRTTGVVDLPNCMSKFLGYGMSLPQVVACATINAARIFPAFKELGTLKVGAPADIALLELRTGKFEYVDNYKNTIVGDQRLFPAGTVCRGRYVKADVRSA